MSELKISRRQFLTGAAVTAAATALPVVSNVTTAAAAPDLPNWPLETPDWVDLDATALARQGYEIYKGKHTNQSACCEGAFWPVIGELGERYPDTWGLVPKGIFNYGGGGVNSWRAMCGVTNAGAAVLKLVLNSSVAIDEYLRWYETTLLPTNATYLDYRAGEWVPGGTAAGVWGGSGLPIPLNNAPKSRAGSVLCHASLANWRVASGTWEQVYSTGQSDRCGKLVYDAVYKQATIINYIKGGGDTTGWGTLDPAVATCETSGCHKDVTDHPKIQSKMKCTSCHDERATDNHWQ